VIVVFTPRDVDVDNVPSLTDEDGAFFVDRDPEYFKPILRFLRYMCV